MQDNDPGFCSFYLTGLDLEFKLDADNMSLEDSILS